MDSHTGNNGVTDSSTAEADSNADEPVWQMWKTFLRRFTKPGLAAILAVLIVFIVGQIFQALPLAQNLESRVGDHLLVLFKTPSKKQDPRISILTVTENTLAEMDVSFHR